MARGVAWVRGSLLRRWHLDEEGPATTDLGYANGAGELNPRGLLEYCRDNEQLGGSDMGFGESEEV
jgi:hypothetical protein